MLPICIYFLIFLKNSLMRFHTLPLPCTRFRCHVGHIYQLENKTSHLFPMISFPLKDRIKVKRKKKPREFSRSKREEKNISRYLQH